MQKSLKTFFAVFIALFSTLCANEFQQNKEMIEIFKANNLRLIVLCNFQGTNNVLDIVTSSRSPGYELTNYGLASLKDAITALASQNITRIYTAPAYRAQQSTNAFGKAFNLIPSQMIIDTRLGMQNFGSADGEDYDIYKSRFTSQQDMFENTPPNGESGITLFNRTENFLESLESLQDRTVLIITHAFNVCHISKCLTGKYGKIPSPGTYMIYDFTTPQFKTFVYKRTGYQA